MNIKNNPASRLTLEDMEEFFDLTLDMICIAGHDGYFKRMNPAWSRVLGHSMEELMAEPFLSFVHPDDRAATIAIAERASREGIDVVSFKNRYRCRDGSYRTLAWTTASSLKRHLLCAVARDVTDSDREEQRLAHLLNSSRAVLYSLAIGPAGVTGCTFMSENITAQLGYAASELVGDVRGWFSGLHPDDVSVISNGAEGLQKSGYQELKYRFRHKNGTYRWMHDERKLVRDAEGAPVEIIGAWRDITESVRDEEIIRNQASALTELSTPLIPISDHVVVMPLIGTMDSQRAAQVLETLLEGVSARRASVAILDITGVSVVDTHVANALLQAAKAVRLLGAEVVLTGIRPDVALTLVGLGLDLTGIVTKGTLQAGIVHAMSGDRRSPSRLRPSAP
ncbi:MAG: PAS domain-containing protein [Byssovorax sp.]